MVKEKVTKINKDNPWRSISKAISWRILASGATFLISYIIFKQYTDKMPYFIGNCDIIIDNEKFNKIKECFIAQSVHTNPILKNKFKFREIPNAKIKIDNYFKELLVSKLGEKYAKNFN